MMWVLAIGNAFDGLNLIGPFATCEEASYMLSDGEEGVVLSLSQPPVELSRVEQLMQKVPDIADAVANELCSESPMPERWQGFADELADIAMLAREID